MASAKKGADIRYPGRPFLLDNSPELEEMTLIATDKHHGSELSRMPFVAMAYETETGWRGRLIHSAIHTHIIDWPSARFRRLTPDESAELEARADLEKAVPEISLDSVDLDPEPGL